MVIQPYLHGHTDNSIPSMHADRAIQTTLYYIICVRFFVMQSLINNHNRCALIRMSFCTFISHLFCVSSQLFLSFILCRQLYILFTKLLQRC